MGWVRKLPKDTTTVLSSPAKRQWSQWGRLSEVVGAPQGVRWGRAWQPGLVPQLSHGAEHSGGTVAVPAPGIRHVPSHQAGACHAINPV